MEKEEEAKKKLSKNSLSDPTMATKFFIDLLEDYDFAKIITIIKKNKEKKPI